jgi:hypothetical protein
MSADVIPVALGTPPVPVTLTPTSLAINSKLSYEEWDDLGRYLAQLHVCTPWWLGDWYLQGEAVYGEKASQANAISEAVEAAGNGKISPRQIQEYAYIAKKFPPEKRVEELSVGHHMAVRTHPKAEALLQQAREHEWTVRDLRDHAVGSKSVKSRFTAGVVWASPVFDTDDVKPYVGALALRGWSIAQSAVVCVEVVAGQLAHGMELLRGWGCRCMYDLVLVNAECQPTKGYLTVVPDHSMLLVAVQGAGQLSPLGLSSVVKLRPGREEAQRLRLVESLTNGMKEDKRLRCWGSPPAGWASI